MSITRLVFLSAAIAGCTAFGATGPGVPDGAAGAGGADALPAPLPDDPEETRAIRKHTTDPGT